jgi:lipid A disaccharide synthetase
MSAGQRSTITLRSREGSPLADDALRNMVEATARAIAERQGVGVIGLASDDESITVTLGSGRIEAMGFAAELRRLTEAWYTSKYAQRTLWGEAPAQPDDAGESWKEA